MGKEAAKGLVEALRHYVIGGEGERIKAGKELIRKYIEKRALDYIESRYRLQGIERLGGLLDGLKELEAEVVKEGVEKFMKKGK